MIPPSAPRGCFLVNVISTAMYVCHRPIPRRASGRDTMTSCCALSIAYPWIEPGIEEIDHEVDGEHHCDIDQDDGLNQRIIPGHDGIEQQGPHTGDQENLLDDDRPPQEARQRPGRHRDNG